MPNSRTRDANVAGISTTRFTGGEELLRQQIAEPTRGLDRPRPLPVELVSPRDELTDLAGTRVHELFTEHHFAFVDRDRGVVRLCGSIPIITIEILQFRHRLRTAVGTPDSRCRTVLTSFEPHRGGTQQPRNSYRKPTRTERQAVRERTTAGPHRRYEQPRNVTPDSIRQFGTGCQ